MAYGFNDDMSKAEFVEIQHNPTREEMIEYASTIGITLRTADPLETWATVLLSYLCNKYVGKSRTVFTGVLNRNTLATYKVLIYDTSKTNGTYNLPQYSIGSIQEYANLKLEFGTESYTFVPYCKGKLYTYETTVSGVPANGTKHLDVTWATLGVSDPTKFVPISITQECGGRWVTARFVRNNETYPNVIMWESLGVSLRVASDVSSVSNIKVRLVYTYK